MSFATCFKNPASSFLRGVPGPDQRDAGRLHYAYTSVQMGLSSSHHHSQCDCCSPPKNPSMGFSHPRYMEVTYLLKIVLVVTNKSGLFLSNLIGSSGSKWCSFVQHVHVPSCFPSNSISQRRPSFNFGFRVRGMPNFRAIS